MTRRDSVRRTVTAALLAALICAATLLELFPTPTGGYLHAGDGLVLLAGFLLGPVWGGLAAGIGSALADIILGYAYYAPGTLPVKAGMAVLAWFILQALSATRMTRGGARVLAALCAEAWMVLGYFLYASLLLGKGAAALYSLPPNLLQGLFGGITGCLLDWLFQKNPALKKQIGGSYGLRTHHKSDQNSDHGAS